MVHENVIEETETSEEAADTAAAEETAAAVLNEAGEEIPGEAADTDLTANYSAYYYRAMCYGMLGYLNEALADYTVCIDNGYDLANAYYQRAQVYAALEDTDNQTADLENSLKYAK